jgi:hypothetical protein
MTKPNKDDDRLPHDDKASPKAEEAGNKADSLEHQHLSSDEWATLMEEESPAEISAAAKTPASGEAIELSDDDFFIESPVEDKVEVVHDDATAIDLALTGTPSKGDSDVVVLGEDVLEDVVVEDIPASAPDHELPLDLSAADIVEEVEKPSPPAPVDSGINLGVADLVDEDETVDLGAEPLVSDHSSAVELGAPPKVVHEVSDADIDLGALPESDEPASPEPGKGKKSTTEIEGEDDEPAPKKQKPRGRAGAWVGGAAIGALAGAGACIGAWFGGLVPGNDAGKPAPQGNPGPQRPAVTFADKIRHLNNGDLDHAKEAGIAEIDAAKPEELVARANYFWSAFVKEQAAKDVQPPFKADAEPVKKALADLSTAIGKKNADALMLRGQIFELTGEPAKARDDYKAGAEQFKDNAGLKERFDTALLALNLRSPQQDARRPRFPREGLNAENLVLLLLAFQAGGGDKAKTNEEAGVRFWQAVKLARENKYGEALKALAEARARHAKRRFLMLKKQQNPLSDPTEEIFLRACDELKAAWELDARLRNPDYLKAGAKDRIPAVDGLLKKVETVAKAEATSGLLKELSDKLLNDKVADKPEDLITLVLAERKKITDKVATLEKNVEAMKKDALAQDEKLKDAAKLAKETGDKLKVAELQVRDLKEGNAQANSALKDIATAAGIKFADLKEDGKKLVQAVQEKDKLAKMKDPKGEIRKLETALAADRATLKQRWNPEEMLGYWLPILQQGRSKAQFGAKAVQDADRVLTSAKSTETDKARAQVIQGLALRNEDKFAGAKPILEKARGALAGSPGPWLAAADLALKEVSDPAGYYTAKAEALATQGRAAEAASTIYQALKVVPGKKGKLLALRSLLALENARAKGPVAPGNATVQAAAKDAKEAAAEGLAEGHFAAGRVAEELGQFKAAIDSYRAAVKAAGDDVALGSRYRIALARALLREASPGKPAEVRRPGKFPALPANLLLAVTLLQAESDETEGSPAQKEAEKLADEVLAKGDKAPFDARAQAWAVKGLFTRALGVYAKGLRDEGLLAPVYANRLNDLVAKFLDEKGPDSRNVPDPLNGERHYAAGLNFYFAKKYANAEKELRAAIEDDNNDARYYYFLGLARLAQGKRGAAEDFDQGARLERLGRPGRAAVSRALERVQGPARFRLNEVRTQPKEREKTK